MRLPRGHSVPSTHTHTHAEMHSHANSSDHPQQRDSQGSVRRVVRPALLEMSESLGGGRSLRAAATVTCSIGRSCHSKKVGADTVNFNQLATLVRGRHMTVHL